MREGAELGLSDQSVCVVADSVDRLLLGLCQTLPKGAGGRVISYQRFGKLLATEAAEPTAAYYYHTRLPDEWPVDSWAMLPRWALQRYRAIPPVFKVLGQDEADRDALPVAVFDRTSDYEIFSVWSKGLVDCVDLSSEKAFGQAWKTLSKAKRWLLCLRSPHAHLSLRGIAALSSREIASWRGDPGSPLRYWACSLGPIRMDHTDTLGATRLRSLVGRLRSVRYELEVGVPEEGRFSQTLDRLYASRELTPRNAPALSHQLHPVFRTWIEDYCDFNPSWALASFGEFPKALWQSWVEPLGDLLARRSLLWPAESRLWSGLADTAFDDWAQRLLREGEAFPKTMPGVARVKVEAARQVVSVLENDPRSRAGLKELSRRALELLNSACELGPQRSELPALYLPLFLFADQMAEAEAYLSTLGEQSASDAGCYDFLASRYELKKNFRECLRWSWRQLEATPVHADALRRALQHETDLAASRRLLGMVEMVYRHNATCRDLLAQRGSRWIDLAQWGLGAGWIERDQAIGRASDAALARLALARARSGRAIDAWRATEEVSAASTDWVELAFRGFAIRGDYAEAGKALARVNREAAASSLWARAVEAAASGEVEKLLPQLESVDASGDGLVGVARILASLLILRPECLRAVADQALAVRNAPLALHVEGFFYKDALLLSAGSPDFVCLRRWREHLSSLEYPDLFERLASTCEGNRPLEETADDHLLALQLAHATLWRWDASGVTPALSALVSRIDGQKVEDAWLIVHLAAIYDLPCPVAAAFKPIEEGWVPSAGLWAWRALAARCAGREDEASELAIRSAGDRFSEWISGAAEGPKIARSLDWPKLPARAW